MGVLSLKDRRVVVVGATSGIGRAIARELSALGAKVAVAGRRAELLESLAAQCPGETLALTTDVRNPEECMALVDHAVEWLGGMDVFVYCPAVVKLVALSDATTEDWVASFETNVLGAVVCTKAALPHLRAAGGHAVYLSSHSTDKVPSWPGLGIYVSTKLALDSVIRSWQDENPEVAFTVIKAGSTHGEHRVLADGASEVGARWIERGLMTDGHLQAEDHAHLLAAILTSPARVEVATIVPR